MSAVSITPANVVPVAGYTSRVIILGATLTAGETVYLKAADGLYYAANSNDATAEVNVVAGILLTGGTAGQPAILMTGGDVVIGGTITTGAYIQGPTAGAINPIDDLVTGMNINIIGFGLNATTLRLAINNTGIVAL